MDALEVEAIGYLTIRLIDGVRGFVGIKIADYVKRWHWLVSLAATRQ